jgi:hypothetical protein
MSRTDCSPDKITVGVIQVKFLGDIFFLGRELAQAGIFCHAGIPQ